MTEALLTQTMTACIATYIHAWYALFAWARAVDTMMAGSRG